MHKTSGELNKSLAAKTDQEKLNLKVQEHILLMANVVVVVVSPGIVTGKQIGRASCRERV